jgi:hypothetical protein
MVYIQKKIKNVWCTILIVNEEGAHRACNHLIVHNPTSEFRISKEKTDDMPIKLRGLSRNEALDALCDIPLVDLTWKQGKEAFRQIVNIVERVRERYKR